MTVVVGRVSIVVPTRNSARTLRATLASARAQAGAEIELIVVDNRSTDETPRIAAELADRVERWGPERSAQRNRGWRVASGELVVFLDSDLALEPGVAREALALFAGEARIGAAVIPEHAHGVGFLAACRGLEKRLYLGDRDVEAARIFRREALAQVGGYDESLDAFEDWELADRVEAAGYALGRVASRAWHDEGRVSLRRAFGKKRSYGRHLARYVDARPRRRRRLLRLGMLSDPRPLARRPDLAAGLVALKGCECAGLLIGAAQGRREVGR
jgi:glycosyltransferase involved in cell wall biosynthesis